MRRTERWYVPSASPRAFALARVRYGVRSLCASGYAVAKSFSFRVSSLYTQLCIQIAQRKVPMKTKVQMWGNSLALRIPKSFASQTHLEPDTLVDLSLVDGNLVVSPIRSATAQLEQLLAGVTEDNLHQEWQTGGVVGREVW